MNDIWTGRVPPSRSSKQQDLSPGTIGPVPFCESHGEVPKTAARHPASVAGDYGNEVIVRGDGTLLRPQDPRLGALEAIPKRIGVSGLDTHQLTHIG
jgi:hypothetical protein